MSHLTISSHFSEKCDCNHHNVASKLFSFCLSIVKWPIKRHWSYKFNPPSHFREIGWDTEIFFFILTKNCFFCRSCQNIDSNFTEFLPKKGNTILNKIHFCWFKKKFSIYYPPVPRRLLYLEREACRQHRGKPFQRCGGQRLSSYSIQFCYFVSVIEL